MAAEVFTGFVCAPVVRKVWLTGVSGAAIIAAVTTLSVGAASAQAADQRPADASGNPATAAPETSAIGEVVVTGSRISRSDLKAESPVSILSSAAIAAAAQPSLDRVVGQMPQFEAAQGAAEVGDAQGSIGFGYGASYSDLRGIGRDRSLVLMDGRRLLSSTPDGSIDLNTIPMSMIDTVEVITGGASTAYGSDAIAGVVNFKLRQNFSGLELNVEHGASTTGDGATNQFSALAGGKFDDGKGDALIDFEYSDRAAVSGSDRSFFTQPAVRFLGRPAEGIIFPGGWGTGATAPSISAINSVLAGYSGTTPVPGAGAYKGSIGVNTNQSLYTSANTGSCAQNYKGVGAEPGAVIGPDCTTAGVILGNYFAVQVPLTKYNFFGKADYEFNAHVTGYAQFNFSDSTALDETSPGGSQPSATVSRVLKVPVANPYVQSNPGLMALLNSAYGGAPPAGAAFYYAKLLYGWGNRVQDFHYRDWQGLVGLKGDIPNTQFTWDFYASYGSSEYFSQAHGDVSTTAINNVLSNEGVNGCNWNPFGISPVSQACLSYAGRTDNTSDVLSSKDVEFSIQGPVFNLPAGPLKVALGADYRQSQFDYQPDSLLVSGDSLSYGSDTPSHGAQDTAEVFAETLAPVLRDLPFAKTVSLDLAYRYSKYNAFSGMNTWKAAGTWTVFSGLQLRGGYSVAVRAPSLANLFVGQSVTKTNVNTDPCDVQSSYRMGANASKVQAICAAEAAGAGASSFTYNGAVVSIPVQSGGDSQLQPETADTWSFGGVLAPVHGLNISVDYYHINIAGAIASLSPNQILADCYGSAANPTFSASNSFCERIQRDPTSGTITLLTSGTFNFNSIMLDGVDTQIDYQFDLNALGLPSNAGRIQLGTVASYLNHYTVTPSDGTHAVDYAGGVSDGLITSDGENLYTHPRWKANSWITYNRGPFTGTLRWRYIGGMANLDLPGSTVPAINYFDIDAHYVINHGVTLSAGINNLADQNPPFISTLELRTDAATYDVVGRTWYIAAKLKF